MVTRRISCKLTTFTIELEQKCNLKNINVYETKQYIYYIIFVSFINLNQTVLKIYTLEIHEL